jgi:hypothetical protein
MRAAADGCPAGTRLHRAWVGARETGGNLDESLAFLRDRRREMVRRENESARLASITRVGAVGGVLMAVGGGLFGASRDFIVGSGLGSGASYTVQQGFAAQSVRDVYNAGVAALSCIEARAISARMAPVAGASAERAALAARIASVEAGLRSLPAPSAGTGTPAEASATAQYLTAAREATTQSRAALSNLDGGALSGPLIANAVYDRTMAIVVQVNNEVDRATPDTTAIMNLARSATATSLNGVADTVQALSEAGRAVREARATTPAAATPAPDPTPAPATARADAETLAEARQTLDRPLADLQQAATNLQDAVARLRGSGIVQVRACAFQQADGQGLTVSAQPESVVAPGGAVVFEATGGRPPYRLTRVGQGAASLIAEPEMSTGAFAIRAQRAAANDSATFLLTDMAGASRAVVVRVGTGNPQTANVAPAPRRAEPPPAPLTAAEAAANECLFRNMASTMSQGSVFAEMEARGIRTATQRAAFMRDPATMAQRVEMAAKICPPRPPGPG